MPLPKQRTLRTVGLLTASIVVSAAALLPALSMRSSSSDDDDAVRRARVAVTQIRLVESSHDLARSLHREAVAVMFDGIDAADATTRADATAQRLDAVSDLDEVLRTMRVAPGPQRDRAERIVRELDRYPLSEPDLELVDLAFLADPVLDATDTGEPDPRQAPHLIELATVAALPVLIADEALVAQIETSGAPTSPAVREHVDEIWPFVRDAGGWLGPGGSVTGRDAFFEVRASRVRAPDAIDDIDRIMRASPLATADGWLRSLPIDVSESPISPADTVAEMHVADAEITAIVADVFSQEIEALNTAADAADADARRTTTWANALFAIAGLAAATALAIVAIAARRAWQRGRLATVDQLTGLGNRHVLDDATAVLLADRRYARHAIAIIDCDRFKMVNDLHGHEVGDLILVEIARRLESAASSLRRRAEARTTIVRLGGDEFLVSVHSRSDIDADLVRAVLAHERRHPLLLDDGLTIPVDFSIGVVVTAQSTDLTDLMHQADLAVYEDKAQRRSQLADLPAPRPVADA